MQWLLPAVSASFLFALGNHVDKYLLSRFQRSGIISDLIIVSGIVGLVVAPLIFLFNPEVLSIAPANMALAALAGIFYVLYLYPYYTALGRGEASAVTPLFQAIPVFSFLLGYFFLDEVLTSWQIAGGLVVMAGSLGLSLRRGSRLMVRADILLPMLAASLLVAVGTMIFKAAALGESFWAAFFWESVGSTGVAAVLLASKEKRRNFVSALGLNGPKFLGVNLFNETINFLSFLLLGYATLLAPIALVNVITGTSPLFTLLIGVAITVFLPRISREDINKAYLVRKSGFILVILAGTLLINL